MQLTKTALAIAVAAGVMHVFATQVMATEAVAQGQKQELEIVCEVGSYGQTTNCRAKGTQEQKQVVYINGRAMRAHKVVDTALDPMMIVIGSSVLLAGLAALALKARTR
jgi:hypothetical protein